VSQLTDSSIAMPSSTQPGVRVAAGDLVWIGVVFAVAIGWAVVLFLQARDRYGRFLIGRYDLGNMVQAVWSTANGRPLEVTNGFTGEQMIRIGAHVDPILMALAPLWIVAPSPLTLIAVQVCAVALGAVPLFMLGKRHLGARPAALLALAYLAYPWIGWTAVDAFHPVTLAIPLFIFCVWALDADRLVVFSICAVLAALTGELMALPIAALGVWYWVARGRRTAGILIAAAGVGWVIVALRVLVPTFSGGASVFYGAYSDVGGSPAGVFRTALTDPLAIVREVTQPTDLLYVLLLALPVGGMFVLAPGIAAVALPQVSANLLANVEWTTDPHSHYIAAVVPFLFAGACLGLRRLSSAAQLRGAIFVLTLSVATTLVAGPWPWAPGTPAWYREGARPEHVSALQEAVDLVPAGAAVSTTSAAGGKLSARRYVYSVPVTGRARWIVLDSHDAWIPRAMAGSSDPARLRAFRSRLESSPRWQKVFDRDGVSVFRLARP
jgi:uncharacterized membrane protein